MLVDSELFNALNSYEYLYLREISEPEDNTLSLRVEEAAASPALTSKEIAEVAFSDLRAIESTKQSRLFELRWKSYIAYSVRNESFVSPDGYEKVEWGKLVCLFSRSRFLDYVGNGTFANQEYPGPFRHVGLICLNHIVDIVSVEPPVVLQLRPAEESIRIH
jgi:hypothetical protein